MSAPIAMEPCPCGRPQLGVHEKPVYLWLCRYGYLEKEIGYAISELERAPDEVNGHDWAACGMRRLRGLVGWSGG